MKTKIIVKKGWHIIAEFNHQIPLSKGDVVVHTNGIEYIVNCLILNLKDNSIEILLNDI